MMFIILLLVCFIYNLSLIPSYNFIYEPVYRTREKYIEDTIRVKNSNHIFSYLYQLTKSNCYDKYILKFFKFIIFNPFLLKKIKIVNDGSYRNVCFLVKPDKIHFSGYYRRSNFLKKRSFIFNLFWFMLLK